MSEGQQYDFMWWEWDPVNLSNDVLAVNPGDTVRAEVFYQTINGQTGWWWCRRFNDRSVRFGS